jgi:hypothetical protein
MIKDGSADTRTDAIKMTLALKLDRARLVGILAENRRGPETLASGGTGSTQPSSDLSSGRVVFREGIRLSRAEPSGA